MKVTIGSGLYQTIYHNGSYFLLFGIRKWQGLKISQE